jgi:ribosome-associated toxin RatA of RatAB toxin-antitoxin module
MMQSFFPAWAACIALSLAAPSATARPTEESKRLMTHRNTEQYEVQKAESTIKAGASRVHVRAPSSVVKKVVLDFAAYERFISEFEKSRVVGKKDDKTDVYLQVPILHGAAKIWAVVRFEPPKAVSEDEEVVSAHMLTGNVKRLDATWRIRKIDDENTQLQLEMLIVPKLPFPGSIITGEVSRAAKFAVRGSRDRAENAMKSKGN